MSAAPAEEPSAAADASLPPLESVGDVIAAAEPAPDAAAAASASANLPIDQLSRSFSGNALAELEQLGGQLTSTILHTYAYLAPAHREHSCA